MADMDTILKGVEREIRLRVSALVPNEYASARFTSPKSLDKDSIKDNTGKERLFKISWGDVTPQTVGTTAIIWKAIAGLTIGYPLNGWGIARASDYQQIFDALNRNDTTVTGCAFREVAGGEIPDIENDDENKWIWATIPIVAVVETQ